MKKIRKVRAVRSAKKRGSRPTLHSPTTAAPCPPMNQARNHVTVASPPYIVGEVPVTGQQVEIPSLGGEMQSGGLPDRTISQMEYAQSKFVAPMGFWARMWASFRVYFGKRRKA